MEVKVWLCKVIFRPIQLDGTKILSQSKEQLMKLNAVCS